ncbi:MAG: hypothetical protein JW874_06275 [Spirochaetales bacterium]|nr:hypothetical protein [Spirochaetales bacterium]
MAGKGDEWENAWAEENRQIRENKNKKSFYDWTGFDKNGMREKFGVCWSKKTFQSRKTG